jgi:hypothetical protein
LMFERIILNHFHINESNYWKLSKIWLMIKLKNSNLKLHKCVSSHNTQLTERKSQFSQHFSCLACPNFLSSTIENSVFIPCRLGHV